MDWLQKAKDDLLKQREEAIQSAAYVREEKRQAFLRKMNYRLNLIERLIKEIDAQRAEVQEEPEEPIEPKPRPTKETMSIRGYQFFYGKEPARAESLRRAKLNWNF